MKYRAQLAAGVWLLICGSMVGAQSRPDINGTWKMNSAKSHFAGSGPTSITIKFVQKDTSLVETLTLGADDGEHSLN